jgi:hypothetical protein
MAGSFVSGHDFSRAINEQKTRAIGPCGSSSELNTLVNIASELAFLGGLPLQGLKGLIILGCDGTTKVVP